MVIPAHNEAENVGPLLRESGAALGTGGAPEYEVVLVDDGSADATSARAQEAAGEVRHLVVVRHASPKGQSFAIVTGVRAARGDGSPPWTATAKTMPPTSRG